MTVKDLMIEGVETAGPDTTAEALALEMENKDVGSILIEEDMEPVGIVTDRDLTRQVLATGADPTEVTAETVMSHSPVTVEIDTGLLEVTNTMAATEVRRMPVVEDGDIVGIITLDDVVTLLVRELDNMGSVITAESPKYD